MAEILELVVTDQGDRIEFVPDGSNGKQWADPAAMARWGFLIEAGSPGTYRQELNSDTPPTEGLQEATLLVRKDLRRS